MRRKILMIRHALSEVNNFDNVGAPVRGAENAPLARQGRLQAAQLGDKLKNVYGMDVTRTPAAVSEFLRTRQTAERSGFLILEPYPVLNEFRADDWPKILADLRSGNLPPELKALAWDLLANPPKEDIWFTHGVLMTAVCHILGIKRDDGRIYPNFCEIIPITIN